MESTKDILHFVFTGMSSSNSISIPWVSFCFSLQQAYHSLSLPCQNLSANIGLILLLLPWGFFKFLLSLAHCCQSMSYCLSCVLVTVQCSGKCEHTEDQKIMMNKITPILQLLLVSMTFLTKSYLMLCEYSEDTIKEIPMYPLTIRTWIWITGTDQR